MKKLFAESIGTFFLVWVGTGAIMINQMTNGGVSNVGIGLAFGLVVMLMIYSFSSISGAHINPAVTIVMFVRKQMEFKDVCLYIVFQLIGAVCASLVNFIVLGGKFANLGMTSPSIGNLQAFIIELLLTFIMMFVILKMGEKKDAYEIIAPIVIGSVIAMEAIFAGPITGASMNPARSIGPAIVMMEYTTIWIYILGPITGALLASFTHNYVK